MVIHVDLFEDDEFLKLSVFVHAFRSYTAIL